MSNYQMKYGVILSYLSFFLSFVTAMLLTPLLIAGMGSEQYGLYQLIGATVGYLGLLDFGFGAAITRYVAKYNAEKDEEGRASFLGLALMIYSVLVVAAVVLGCVAYAYIDKVFPKLTVTELEQARVMLCFLVASLAFSLIGNIFQGALIGSQQFIFIRSLAVVSEILRVVGTLFIVYKKYGAVELTLMGSLLGIFSWFVCSLYFFRKMHFRIVFHSFDKALVMEIFTFSFFIFLGQIMTVMYWRIGILMLGILSTTTAVAIYSIALNLNGIFLMFVTSINSVLLPKLTHMVVGKASSEEKTLFIARVGRIILFVYGYLYIGFAFFGRDFILNWVGPDYEEAWLITMIVVTAGAIPRIQGAANDLMKAMNKHHFLSFIYVLMGLLNVGIAYLLVKPFGLIGIALGTAVALVIGNVIIANIYYHRALGVQIRPFFSILLSQSGVSLICCGLMALGLGLMPLTGWMGLFVKGALFSFMYIIVIWRFAMKAYEKDLLLSLLPKALYEKIF